MNSLPELESRFAEIADRLRRIDSPAARASVRAEIIAFFRDVDELHEAVGDLRRSVRGLVEEYKTLPGGAANDPRRGSVHGDGLNSSSFLERGWNLIAAEKHAEAVAALEKALALWPGNVEAEGLMGWALMKEGRYERALGCLQRVLLAEPDNEMARVNLGYVCFRRGIHGEAEEHLTGALERGRDKKAALYAHLYLGLLHAVRHEPEAARTSFERTIELGPNMIEAYYHLGLLLYQQGKADEARALWKSAVERNAYNLWSKKSKASIEELDAGRPIEAS